MTKILAFDTATAACSAALWCDGLLQQHYEIAPRCHSQLLLPMIDRLLKEASLSVRDCDAIGFGQGPGSFMGVRLAASIAQGLALGAGIPVVPVSTLQALAQTAFWQMAVDTLLVGWDARMQQVYWGVYHHAKHGVQAIIPDQLSAPSDITIPTEVDCAAGNAWALYANSLPSVIAHLPQPKPECYPTARAVAFLAAKAFDLGKHIKPEAIELAYLRNQVAQAPSR